MHAMACAATGFALALASSSNLRRACARQVIHEARHQRVGDQTCRGHAIVDDLRLHRLLHEPLAAPARPLAADVPVHEELMAPSSVYRPDSSLLPPWRTQPSSLRTRLSSFCQSRRFIRLSSNHCSVRTVRVTSSPANVSLTE